MNVYAIDYIALIKLDKMKLVETCFSKFNLLLISITKSVTESTDEMIVEFFIFKRYLFSFFITPHNHYSEIM